jgi:hypothetical protein
MASSRSDTLEARHNQRVDAGTADIDYLVRTSDILFEYFSDNNGSMRADSLLTDTDADAGDALGLLRYFAPSSSSSPQQQAPTGPNARATLSRRYDTVVRTGHEVGGERKHTQVKKQCSECGGVEWSMPGHDGLVACDGCGCVDGLLIDHDRSSFKEPPRASACQAYRRSNHFSEWMAQIQGRETTAVPESVFDAVRAEMSKRRISDPANTMNRDAMKQILKQLGCSKYYEHVTYILHRVAGIPPPHFGPDLERRLRDMFQVVQPVFLRHAPANRINALSYSYVLYQLLRLVDRDDLLPHVSLLKSREKLHAHDVTWIKICKDLNWRYAATV